MRANRTGSTRRIGLTKDEVLAALRVCAKKLGHVPTRKEFRKLAGISEKVVSNRFGSYGKALREAGFDPVGPGHQWSDDRLLLDWAQVARKLGKIPTKDEYSANSRHSTTPFDARWKTWRDVGPGFVVYARSEGIDDEWADVLEMVTASGYRIIGSSEYREELIGLKEEFSPQRAQRARRQLRENSKFKGKSLPQMNAGQMKLPGLPELPRLPGLKSRSAQKGKARAKGRPAEGKFENRKLKRVEFGKRALKPGKPVYGPRLDWPGMIFAPL